MCIILAQVLCGSARWDCGALASRPGSSDLAQLVVMHLGELMKKVSGLGCSHPHHRTTCTDEDLVEDSSRMMHA